MLNVQRKLSWPRGPAVLQVVERAAEVRTWLAAERRGFLSLRRVAAVLGVSTHPVRVWVREGHLKRDGPRGQVSRQELARFLDWLCDLPSQFGPFALHPIRRAGGRSPYQKLRRASFVWPRGRKWLSSTELAELSGCDASYVRQALRRLLAPHLRSHVQGAHWRVTSRQWRRCFCS